MGKYSTKWRYDLEKHPFGGPYIPQDASHLIIGTFPTRRQNRLFEFYYSGETNMFWRILENVFHFNFEYGLKAKATKERKEFLKKHKIGIMDMHELCYRKDNKSQDHNLYSVLLTDVQSILKQNPKVTDLIFTSRTDGVGAFGLFNNYLIQKGMVALELDNDENDGLKYTDYYFDERLIEIWVPYSPSKSSNESKKLGVERLAKMYMKCFTKILK